MAAAHGQGVLFRMTTDGAFTTLHQFNGDEGGGPRFRLLLASDQKLYGVADGGAGGAGAIFRFDPAQIGNHPPLGVDDLAFMPLKEGPLTIAVLANDTDPDNDPLTVTSVTDGQYGTVSNNHDGTVTYVPGPLFSFVRDDAFLYNINDGHGGESAATIRIRSLNDFAGQYSDLLLTTASQEPAGMARISLTKTGTFTGQIRLSGTNYNFHGTVDSGGHAAISIKRPKATPLILKLEISTFFSSLLDGTLTADAVDYNFTARQSSLFLTIPPRVGAYNLVLPPAAATHDDPTYPLGIGYGTLRIAKTGTVRITGKLGDGVSFSAGSAVRSDGAIPLYATFYTKPKGLLLGMPTIPYLSDQRVTGDLSWTKPQHPKDARYPIGFATTTTFDAGFYFAPGTARDTDDPPTSSRVLSDLDPDGNARLSLSGGGMTTPLTLDLNVSLRNTVTPSSNLVSLKFAPKTGIFTAVVNDLQSGKRITGHGVIQQAQGRGAGLFLEPTSTGAVVLDPNP